LVASEESFLNYLFCVGFIAGDAEGYTEDGVTMAYYKCAVGFFVSG
jgi:hypothetical protein